MSSQSTQPDTVAPNPRDLARARAALIDLPEVRDAEVTLLPGRAVDRRLVALVVPAGAAPPGSGEGEPDPGGAAAVGTAAQAARAALHAAGLGPDDRARIAALVARLDNAALLATAHTLRPSGLAEGARLTVTEVCERLAVAPRHRWLVRRWLADLAAAGRVEQVTGPYHEATRWTGLADVDDRILRRACRELDRARRGLGYPAALTRFMLTSVGRLPALLRDEVAVQAVLFPGGTIGTALGGYRDNVASQVTGAACAALMRRLAEDARDRGARPLTVLEVGAGVGGTTDDVLDALAGLPATFHFTDLSRFFVDAARERLAGRATPPQLRFALLDVDEDLGAQGFGAGSVDVVLAANVLHNVRHVGHALAALRGMLAPGGRLALVEFCRDHPYMTISMAFMAGRVGAEDGSFVDARQGRGRVFLTTPEWHTQLRAAGLVPEAELPGEHSPLAPLAQQLLVARRPLESAADTPAAAGWSGAEDAVRAVLAAVLPAAPRPAAVSFVPALVNSLKPDDTAVLVPEEVS